MFVKSSLLVLCSGVLVQSDAEAGWWFRNGAKHRVGKEEWDESKTIWGQNIGRRVSDQMDDVDPTSEAAVDPARLRKGLEMAIQVIDEMTASPEAFKAALVSDPVWGEVLEQNPELKELLEDPAKVQADMEMLKEVRKDLKSQLKPRKFRKFMRDVRDAQAKLTAAMEFQAKLAEASRGSLLELEGPAPAVAEVPAVPSGPLLRADALELPKALPRLRGGEKKLAAAAKAAAALNMAVWGFYGAALLANPGWMMQNVMMADPAIFASGPARQVAQYLGAVYLAQAKKMQGALTDASSAKGHLSDAAVVNGLLTATSLLSLASGELNAVSLSLPAGQALMTALSARGARKAE